MEKKLFVIDGDDFTNEEEFYEEFSRVVIPGVDWGRNINSFQAERWERVRVLAGGFFSSFEKLLA
jgi:RNAse (barnase) inhibitor barstar